MSFYLSLEKKLWVEDVNFVDLQTLDSPELGPKSLHLGVIDIIRKQRLNLSPRSEQ